VKQIQATDILEISYQAMILGELYDKPSHEPYLENTCFRNQLKLLRLANLLLSPVEIERIVRKAEEILLEFEEENECLD